MTHLPAFRNIESLLPEGTLHVAAIEVQSGKTWSYQSDTPVSTASTIKLPILIHTAMQAGNGELAWDSQIPVQKDDLVGGMGVLRHMHTPGTVRLDDACYLMTALSDNTATNLVLDQTGIEPVNATLNIFGCANTRLYRKVFHPDTPESMEFGLGVTTAADMLRIMQLLYAPHTLGEGVSLPDERAVEFCKTMLALQQDRVGVARIVPDAWTYAGKTGRVTSTRGEAAMVSAPDDRMWLLGIFVHGLTVPDLTIQNPGLLAIARAADFIINDTIRTLTP